MFKKLRRLLGIHEKAKSGQRASAGRRLQFEQYEDRCMLAVMADIVFLVDESGSGAEIFNYQSKRAAAVGRTSVTIITMLLACRTFPMRRGTS